MFCFVFFLSVYHEVVAVMVMCGSPSPSQHALCLTFMGLKSSEWWSARVWDGKLHRFNWEESSLLGLLEVPVGWPWAEQHVVHPYKKKGGGKIWRYFSLYDAKINLSTYSRINLHPGFTKYCFISLCAIFYFLLPINTNHHKGLMFSSILLQNDHKSNVLLKPEAISPL